MTSDPPKGRLVARGLVVSRAGRRLLDGADFAIEAGSIAVIEGPSGSGKTTLLRALATLIAADSGSIALDGEDAAAIAPTAYRRRVAYVPQQPPMLEGTVADNVAMGPRLAGREPAPATITALLDRVGLPAELHERAARDLSGGERQRVALARALGNEPAFLLLDEPTSALDPLAAARVLDLVKELAHQGLGVVVVTHVEEHARSLGGARYVFAEGRVTPRAGE